MKMLVNGFQQIIKVCLFVLSFSALATGCTEDEIPCGDENNPCDEIVIEDIVNPLTSGGGIVIEDILDPLQADGDPGQDSTGIVIEDIVNP